MKFIYVFDEEIKDELITKGLRLVQETMIGEKKAFALENKKDVWINKYTKDQILLSNRLFF